MNRFVIKILRMIKNYFFVLLFFFVLQSGFSQTEKLISGKVLNEQFPLEKVDVVNFISKKITITTKTGEFSILAKAGDELIFISKNHHVKKVILHQKTIDGNNFIILLTLKPEQLDEVVITKMPSIKLSLDKDYEQGKLDELTLEKSVSSLKTGVSNGPIKNGMNLIRIGGMIIRLFTKEKELVKKDSPKIEFKDYTKSTLNKDYYLTNLQLKPEKINLFLEFCDADPKSKTIIENVNILTLMDFLATKNSEFKKL